MSFLPFIHFFCLFIYVYLAIFILVRNPKAHLNRVCSALFICFALWSFGGVVSHNPITSKATLFLFENVTSAGWIGFNSFLLWAVLLFAKKEKILKSRFFYPLLFFPPLLLIYKQWTNFMVVDFIKKHYGWGIVWSTSIWPFLYYFYIILFSGTALFLFFRIWISSDDGIKKKQAKVIFLTSSIGLLLGCLTDIILPKLHYYELPDIADITAIMGVLGLAYTMIKYRFLTITPATAAENIIATMSDSLILLDAAGNIARVNQATLDLLGYREKELKGKPLAILLEDKHDQRKKNLFEEVPKGKDMVNYELTFKTKQGSKIPVIFSSSALKDESGTLIGVICINKDITQRKKAEKELNAYKEHLEELVEERTQKLKEINLQLQKEIDDRKIVEKTLRKSKEKYKTLTKNINVGIYRHTVGEDGEFIEANPATIKMFGYDNKQSFLDTRVSQHYKNPEDLERFNQKMSRYGFVKDEEILLKRKDGTPFIGSVSVVGVKDDQGKMIYFDGMIEDITHRKRLEEQLLQSQKIEAVGRLSGGIAHEFNNMLTSIIGYTELLQKDLQYKTPKSDYFDKILNTAGHAAELVRQLLTFSRKAVIRPKIVNLNQVLRGFQKLIQRVIGEDILLDFIPGENLRNVKVDPGQIEQIIMNLAANSRDAMPSGGKLTIKTENKELDETTIHQSPYIKPGFYVLLTVSDTGCGMSQSELSYVFEPFFTTKREARGTGLGLSTVYGIVKQNDGYINFESEPNQGTTVSIYLPPVDAPVESLKKKPDDVQLPPGKETILVVEDEKTVCEITLKVLSDCGYNIIMSKNGEEALVLWEKNKDQVDLLLTDIVLPGISGLKLAQRLLASKPELKVIYMSGYSEDVIAHHGILDNNISLIQKPFTSMILSKKIREVLK